MVRLLDKLEAIVRRELLSALRYRGGFVLELLGLVAEIAAFFFLARAIGPGFRPEGIGYFPFLLVGTSFYTFLLMGITVFVDSVRKAQLAGSMEVLMTTATPGTTILLLDALAAFFARSLYLVFALLIGFVVFGAPLAHPHLPAFALAFVLSLAVGIGMGTVAAAIQVATQKASSAIWLFGSVTALLTGTMFPVSVLPDFAQKVASLVPITHSLNAFRGSLLRGAGVRDLLEPLAVLAVYAIVLLPLSLVLFSHVLARARRNWTLSLY